MPIFSAIPRYILQTDVPWRLYDGQVPFLRTHRIHVTGMRAGRASRRTETRTRVRRTGTITRANGFTVTDTSETNVAVGARIQNVDSGAVSDANYAIPRCFSWSARGYQYRASGKMKGATFRRRQGCLVRLDWHEGNQGLIDLFTQKYYK